MANERKTDFFIGALLTSANIDFTPNGSDIKEVADALKSSSKKGTGKSGYPEFIAKVKDYLIVIENKADTDRQALYVDDDQLQLDLDIKSVTNYAENGALHYAKHILENTTYKKIFAFGCSGDEKHHKIRPIFIGSDKQYKLLEYVENFENFNDDNIDKYYNEQVLGETPVETLELQDILKKSKELHEDLRNYGQLGDSEKPLVVSALLLALSEKDFNIDTLTGDYITTDGKKIFDYMDSYMKRVEVMPGIKKDKVLNQFNLIKDRAILNKADKRNDKNNPKDEKIEKTPLRHFAEYLQKNILATIKKSSTEDVLGRFYGEFIRYSGGDGQSLGVVLTPRHITDIFCRLLEVKPSDIIFDPCCGTGGFLIAAMHHMLEKSKSKKQRDQIKKDHLHGVEIREDMFSVATTNMILRGDGKSNLENKDFLLMATEEIRKKKCTVGLMNPPYSQSKGKDTKHLSEICFIEHLLDGLAENGRSAVIIPQSTMVGKTSEDKKVKRRILKKHTLEGVITLNKNTFYGVGTNACIAIFTSHKPHDEKKYCKFINFEDDGYEVQKHVGLVATTRAEEKKAHLLDCWLHGKPAESKFMVLTTIEPDDEWLHSFYYFNDEIPKESDFDKTISDYLTFELSMVMQGREYLFNEI
ncbi:MULTISPECIES: HsdM family class I SAM-dependent methyltransferase [Cysteiniphilum]|uniref:HsdM family class I SAM-dependent methyltransferase n=1 Tax=Cysteiniphilum TaxID=2056696 RepID=UPI001783439C|nr:MULTISPECIES: N-6 DNA methylase [Cysteiniphilum]